MTTRKILLCIGAAVLTACAQPASDTPQSNMLETVERVSDDPVIVTVNGTEIFASDINLFAQEQSVIDEGERLPPADARYQGLLDELIDQRLLALDADARDLASEQEAKIRLAAARERILGNLRVERHLRDTVNETSIRRMYEEQAKLAARGDEVRARHILVEEKSLADKLLKQIRDGSDFTALARTNSIDEGSAERGGDLGYFTQDMLNGRFTKPIFNAGKGEYIGPVKSEFGWHIAEVLDRRPAPQPTFETLRPKIVNFMTFDAIQDLLTELRAAGEVEILVEGLPDKETADETPENE